MTGERDGGERDGGAAFPRSDAGYSPTQDGMSLRDWFAGQALASLGPLDHFPTNYQGEARDKIVARAAYKYADAMLSERSRP